jgi:hypothetical protein
MPVVYREDMLTHIRALERRDDTKEKSQSRAGESRSSPREERIADSCMKVSRLSMIRVGKGGGGVQLMLAEISKLESES